MQEQKKLNNYINKEKSKLDKGIVATPNSREYLDAFALANQGCNDVLLTQMAVNYGYSIALENIADELQFIYG